MRLYNADVIDALVEHGQVTAMSRVMDVGTGTGFVAAGLAGQAATAISPLWTWRTFGWLQASLIICPSPMTAWMSRWQI